MWVKLKIIVWNSFFPPSDTEEEGKHEIIKKEREEKAHIMEFIKIRMNSIDWMLLTVLSGKTFLPTRSDFFFATIVCSCVSFSERKRIKVNHKYVFRFLLFLPSTPSFS